ncbi:MAG: hypothetical protein AAGU11_07355 [Syntrophobacteraceae bacterium]
MGQGRVSHSIWALITKRWAASAGATGVARIFVWMFGQGFKTRIAMKPSRIAATLMLVAPGLFCCLIPGAQRVRYE